MTQIINSKYKRGWDRLDPDHMGDISYDAGTQTFSIAVKTGKEYFHFFAGDEYFKYTTTKSVVFPDVTGTYYFYFDTSGDLQYILSENITEAIFLQSAISGICYYNATTGTFILKGIDEQHGIIMDASTHFHEHLTRGFAWSHGVEIEGLANGSGTYTKTTSGLAFDEDIPISFAELSTHSFIYRDGATGEWNEITADNKCGHIAGGDTYVSYNQWTGATWQLTEASGASDFIIMMILATNDETNPIKKVVGQQVYANANAARAGMRDELKAIKLDGFPGTEVEYYYAYIINRDGNIVLDSNGDTHVDLRGIPLNSLNN